MSDSEQGETTVQDRPSDVESSTSSSVESSGSSTSASASGSPASGSSSEAEVPESGTSAESEGSPEADESDDSGEDDDAEGASSKRSSRRASVRDLEEEGEVAADYLEELLDIVDVDGDIDIDVENGRASLAIVAEGGSDRSLRRLVGSSGEVLEALQELTRLAVQASTGERSRLMLDVAGHRANRRRILTDKAGKACEEVKRTGASVKMEPMSAFERKIVHDVVAEAGLDSESEGTDPNRFVVVLPASA